MIDRLATLYKYTKSSDKFYSTGPSQEMNKLCLLAKALAGA